MSESGPEEAVRYLRLRFGLRVRKQTDHKASPIPEETA